MKRLPLATIFLLCLVETGVACSHRTRIQTTNVASKVKSAAVVPRPTQPAKRPPWERLEPAPGTWLAGSELEWQGHSPALTVEVPSGRLRLAYTRDSRWAQVSPRGTKALVRDFLLRPAFVDMLSRSELEIVGGIPPDLNEFQSVWSPKDDILVTDSHNDSTFYVFDLGSGTVRRHRPCMLPGGFTSGTECILFDPEGTLIAHSDYSRTTVEDARSGRLVRDLGKGARVVGFLDTKLALVQYPSRSRASNNCYLGETGVGGVLNLRTGRMLWSTQSGAMLQLSPDGRFVLKTIVEPGSEGWAVLDSRTGVLAARWNWSGAECLPFHWREGPKAGLASVDRAGVTIWTEENGRAVLSKGSDVPGSSICSSPDGEYVWADTGLYRWAQPEASIVEGVSVVDDCSWGGQSLVLQRINRLEVRRASGEVVRVLPEGASSPYWLAGAERMVAWLPAHNDNPKWVCVDDLDTKERICLTVARKSSGPFLFAVSKSGFQNGSANDVVVEGLLARRPPLQMGQSEGAPLRFCKDLVNRFFLREPCK